MNFLNQVEYLNVIIQEISYLAPKNWERIVYYTERLEDKDIGVRNKSTAECWIGRDMKPFDNSKEPPLRGSMELFEAVNNLFQAAKSSGKIWCGLLLTINSDGKYFSKFYYEDTPLLDGNDIELSKRLAEINT